MDRFICNRCLCEFAKYGKYKKHLKACHERGNEIQRQIDEMTKEFEKLFPPKPKQQPIQSPLLTEIQQKGIDFSFKKSKIYHTSTYLNVVKLFMDLGYDEQDLKQVLDYMLVVPVTINFPSKLLPEFIADGRYKNCFEVSKGNQCGYGQTRKVWERFLFKGIYDNATPKECVKYGAINLFSEPNGLIACSPYGGSVFVLKNNVKERMSITPADSIHQEWVLATFKWCCQLFLHITKEVLTDLIKFVRREINVHNYMCDYIEVQIHGDVLFDRDIEKVILENEKYEPICKEFCQKFGVTYEIKQTN